MKEIKHTGILKNRLPEATAESALSDGTVTSANIYHCVVYIIVRYLYFLGNVIVRVAQ